MTHKILDKCLEVFKIPSALARGLLKTKKMLSVQITLESLNFRYTENTKDRKRRMCAIITGVDTSSNKNAKLSMAATSETSSGARNEQG